MEKSKTTPPSLIKRTETNIRVTDPVEWEEWNRFMEWAQTLTRIERLKLMGESHDN